MAKGVSKAVGQMLAKQMAAAMPSFDEDAAINSTERDCQIMTAYNWFNTFSEPKKERMWFCEYAKEKKLFTPAKLTQIKTMDLKWFYYVGRVCKMDLNDFPLVFDNKHNKARFDTLIGKIESRFKANKNASKIITIEIDSNKPTIQDKINEKAQEYAADIQNLMDDYILDIKNIKKSDDGDYVNVESFLNVNKVKPMIASRMVQWVVNQSQEWNDVVGTKDKDLKEGYDIYTLSEQKRIVKMYKNTIDLLNARAATKTVRKTRKKKVKTPKQLVSSVQYLESTKDFGGIESIKPEKIIGKSRVVLFNTKYRQITILEAENPHLGLSIKGTTVTGIDASESVSKRVREKYVKDLLKVSGDRGIRAIKKSYNAIKAKDLDAKGRINKDTLIVRVM